MNKKERFFKQLIQNFERKKVKHIFLRGHEFIKNNKDHEEIDILVKKFDLKKVNEKTKIPYLIAKDIPVNKMNDFYNECKVFISLPNQDAGFNNVWAEAMAAGVPIVIGNYNGPGESFPIEKIKNRKNKINEIKEIIENPKKLNYRKWLKEKKISWENSVKKTERVFKKFKK